MNRVLAGLLALVLVAGCASSTASTPGATPGDSTGPAGPSPSGAIELAAASVPRQATAAADASSAGSAVNALGLDLYARLVAADPAASLVFSPASVQLALAMARAGARGRTATEMDAVMHALGADANAAWAAALDASLNARSVTVENATGAGGEPQRVVLRSVNAPFAQAGFPLEPAYLDALAARFGAGLRLVDFAGDPDGSRGAINGWVDEQTERRIPELLGPGSVDPSTGLVLVNAIYLNAAWATPFAAEATAPASFTRLDGATVEVPTMRGTLQAPYAAGHGWRAVDLPYVGGQLSMLVIVPDDLAAFEASLDADRLAAIIRALAPAQVRLGLPRFGTETRVELADVLARLGMPTAFSDGADFSGITVRARLLIDAVVHQANIDVDEKGTEAAAATAIVMRESAVAGEPVTLTVDRPFVFALRDLETGAVLFLGRVTEPSDRS